MSAIDITIVVREITLGRAIKKELMQQNKAKKIKSDNYTKSNRQQVKYCYHNIGRIFLKFFCKYFANITTHLYCSYI